jgi:hypothetical protein
MYSIQIQFISFRVPCGGLPAPRHLLQLPFTFTPLPVVGTCGAAAFCWFFPAQEQQGGAQDSWRMLQGLTVRFRGHAAGPATVWGHHHPVPSLSLSRGSHPALCAVEGSQGAEEEGHTRHPAPPSPTDPATSLLRGVTARLSPDWAADALCFPHLCTSPGAVRTLLSHTAFGVTQAHNKAAHCARHRSCTESGSCRLVACAQLLPSLACAGVSTAVWSFSSTADVMSTSRTHSAIGACCHTRTGPQLGNCPTL